MYEVIEHKLEGSNFFAGSYPVASDVFKVKDGEESKIKKGSPIVLSGDEDGSVAAATSENLSEMIGIASSEPDSKTVAVVFTGEILLSAVVLPETVEADDMVKEARKHCIFLK